jgi:hypothetical protein
LQHYSPTTMKGYFAKPITSHLWKETTKKMLDINLTQPLH